MTKLVKNRILNQLNYLKSFGYEYHESLDLFSNNIKNVNEKSFCANVEIDLSECGNMEIEGEFGYNDFEAEFGFIFLK